MYGFFLGFFTIAIKAFGFFIDEVQPSPVSISILLIAGTPCELLAQ
jgi:hypothetical protein